MDYNQFWNNRKPDNEPEKVDWDEEFDNDNTCSEEEIQKEYNELINSDDPSCDDCSEDKLPDDSVLDEQDDSEAPEAEDEMIDDSEMYSVSSLFDIDEEETTEEKVEQKDDDIFVPVFVPYSEETDPQTQPVPEPEPTSEPIVESDSIEIEPQYVEQEAEAEYEPVQEEPAQVESVPDEMQFVALEPEQEPEPEAVPEFVPGPMSEPVVESDSLEIEPQYVEQESEAESEPVQEEPAQMESAPAEPQFAALEPEPEYVPEPVCSLPLLDEIMSFIPAYCSFGTYLKSLSNDDATDLEQFIQKTKQTWLGDKKDKIFTIPGSDISVAVLNDTTDPMTAVQRLESIGAQMFAHEKTKWNALKLFFDEEGKLKRSEISEIKQEDFEDWQWRIAQEMGFKIYKAMQNRK